MSQSIKPIKVWGRGGPNPPKVAMVLAELQVPYEVIDVPLSDVKKPEYLKLNPNGRLPYIEDDNTGVKIWESGAIIEYLIQQYDKDNRLSFTVDTPEYWQAKQWLFYQVSGQGPYFGQAVWFTKFHPEKVPSAFDRYTKEVDRVTGTLDAWLTKQEEQFSDQQGFDGPWLVGNKYSYADLSFLMWHLVVQAVVSKDENDLTRWTRVEAWMKKILERDNIKKVVIESGVGQMLNIS